MASRLQQCSLKVREAIAGLSADEVEEAADAIDGLLRINPGTQSVDQAAMDALDEALTELTKLRTIEKRNAYLNHVRRSRLLNHLKENYADDPVRGMEAIVAGIQSSRTSSRASLDNMIDSLMKEYLNGFEGAFKGRPDLWAKFTAQDETTDRQLVNALFRLDDENPDLSEFDADIIEIARIMKDAQELMRQDANFAGAWIGKIKGYAVTQTHDAMKIRRVTADQWIAKILPRLDQRTFKGRDPETFLRAAYEDLARGVHVRVSKEGAPTGLKGVGNVGRSMSHERTLHFNSGDDWYDYHLEFGNDETLRGAFFSSIQTHARKTATMRLLGPNARDNLNKVGDLFIKSGTIKNKALEAKLKDSLAGGHAFDIDSLYRQVDGSASLPPSEGGDTLANIGAGVRAFEILSKLGSMIYAVITDLPLSAMAGDYRGISPMAMMGDGVKTLFSNIGKTPADVREASNMLGIFSDSMIQNIASRFQVEETIPGRMNGMVNTFFRWNLAAWWTDSLRTSSAFMFSGQIATSINKSWGDLGDLSRALQRSGFDEGQWAIMQKADLHDMRGNKLFVPEKLRDLDDSLFEQYLTSTGQKVTKRSVRELREDMEQRLRGYFIDSAEEAVINPDARTRAYTTWGTTRGTGIGEIVRFISQFKTFGAAVVQRQLGRDLFGRGGYQYDPEKSVMVNAVQAMFQGTNGEGTATMKLIALTTMFGYMSASVKDWAKGREPKVPFTEDMSAGDNAAIMFRSLTQGGGLGILGDLVVGQLGTDRFGQNWVASIAGPAAGTAEDLRKLGASVLTGNFDKTPDRLFDTISHNAPYANHFLLRPTADYIMLNTIQEMINPGYLYRTQKRIKRDLGQGTSDGVYAHFKHGQLIEDID